MKWRSRSRKRRFSKTPSSTTCSSASRGGRILAPGDRAPGLEPLLARAERADARLHAVGDDQRRVGREQRRDLRLVGLELLEGRPDRRRSRRPAFFSSITASGRPLTNSTTSGRRVCWPSATVNWLTASQSLLSGVVEVDDPRLRAGDRAVRAAVLDRHAIDQHPVDGAVALDERRRVGRASACGRRRPAPRAAGRG